MCSRPLIFYFKSFCNHYTNYSFSLGIFMNVIIYVSITIYFFTTLPFSLVAVKKSTSLNLAVIPGHAKCQKPQSFPFSMSLTIGTV